MKNNRRPIISVPILLFTVIFFITSTPQAAWIPGTKSPAEITQTTPDTPLLARIYYKNFAELNHLAATLDIWKVNHERGYILAFLPSPHYLDIIPSGLRVEIDHEFTRFLTQQNQFFPDQLNGIPGYPCYRTVEETYSDLSQLAVDYPNLATWIDIGDSWEKVTPGGELGYDLHTLLLTNSTIPGPKPKIYLISAIHGRELPTAELATRFAEHLVENYNVDPDITWLLDHVEVHITPHANPDGRKIAETGVYWRKNTDNDDGCFTSSLWGTDLNRNSSFKWGGVGASASPCDITYRGPSPASEPETQAIQNYAGAIFPDQRGSSDTDPAPDDAEGIFITLHSYGNLVLFPWGWTKESPPNDTSLETLGRKFGFFTSYQVCQSGEEGCLYQTSGDTDDWLYGELGVASYTIELGTTHFESCDYFEQAILPDNLQALLYALKASRRPYKDPAGPESREIALSAEHIAPGAGLILTTTADDSRYNSNGKGDEPVQNVSAARYSIDLPSWYAGVSTYPLAANDGNFNNPVESLFAMVDTTDLEFGRHTIFVESQDSDGNWGVPTAAFLWIKAEEYMAGIVPDQPTQGGLPGSVTMHTLQVTNLGTQDDTFTIQVTGNSWDTILSHDFIGPQIPGQSEELLIQVTIPDIAQVGDQEAITLTATSRGDPSKITSVTLKTAAVGPASFLPLISR